MAQISPSRGRLTIFFGAAPGVGKTYAMLEAARGERDQRRDVAVGIVETHGRYDTGALLLGLEIVPRRKIEHRGIELEELDLDAALARRPDLLLVDELAHANAPGSRHAKRWQDVEELLAAGIDVYTTMNVQHLESLNDVVAQITHVVVKETVPDSVLERADDVRLIDLPIDELLERLRDGKVYVPERARIAAASFFKEGNLIALRELALRVTAQQVDAEMRRYRTAHGIERTWPAADRVLVCVSASPASERLVRGARRLARSTHSEWIAAWVDGPDAIRMTKRNRDQLDANLALARSLGAETVSLSSDETAGEIIRFARTRNVTRIVVGKPTHSSLRDRLRPSFLDRLVRVSGDIDIHVMTGVDALEKLVPPVAAPPPRAVTGYAAAAALVALATAIGSATFAPTQTADVLMLYLLAIVLVSMRWGIAPSVFATIIAILGFDYFFVPPYRTFFVTDLRHVGTFGIMFVVAVVISGLTRRVREQADSARRREVRTASLYSLSRALSSAKSTGEVAAAATKNTSDVFDVEATLSIPLAGDSLAQSSVDAWGFALDDKDVEAAKWAYRHGGIAGRGTSTLPGVSAMHVALAGTTTRVGVLSIRPRSGAALALDNDTRNHLDAFASQIAAAVERARLAEIAQRAELRAQSEQLKNSLLSSVSHDLRTPLAVITGTASAMLESNLGEADRRDLTRAILEESERLARLVTNLLDVTRLEAGAVQPNKEWQHVEEVVGAALGRADRLLGGRKVTIDVPASLPLVSFDSVLVEQVLVNLLENAAKYTPNESAIDLSARVDASTDSLEVSVADRGPGLAAGEERKIFEKFYRAHKGRGGGAGLGLAICEGIVSAHGGRIWAENREGGGAVFRFTLPKGADAPALQDLPDSVPSAEDRASA